MGVPASSAHRTQRLALLASGAPGRHAASLVAHLPHAHLDLLHGLAGPHQVRHHELDAVRVHVAQVVHDVVVVGGDVLEAGVRRAVGVPPGVARARQGAGVPPAGRHGRGLEPRQDTAHVGRVALHAQDVASREDDAPLRDRERRRLALGAPLGAAEAAVVPGELPHLPALDYHQTLVAAVFQYPGLLRVPDGFVRLRMVVAICPGPGPLHRVGHLQQVSRSGDADPLPDVQELRGSHVAEQRVLALHAELGADTRVGDIERPLASLRDVAPGPPEPLPFGAVRGSAHTLAAVEHLKRLADSVAVQHVGVRFRHHLAGGREVSLRSGGVIRVRQWCELKALPAFDQLGIVSLLPVQALASGGACRAPEVTAVVVDDEQSLGAAGIERR
mmetsp:Transcript_43668/g.123620  ORF Transcript_43668/g.123620 Transcript_43668/m.123620 type:complete len:388 (+) Transcript_43668:43-1206(+)